MPYTSHNAHYVKLLRMALTQLRLKLARLSFLTKSVSHRASICILSRSNDVSHPVEFGLWSFSLWRLDTPIGRSVRSTRNSLCSSAKAPCGQYQYAVPFSRRVIPIKQQRGRHVGLDRTATGQRRVGAAFDPSIPIWNEVLGDLAWLSLFQAPTVVGANAEMHYIFNRRGFCGGSHANRRWRSRLHAHGRRYVVKRTLPIS